jgi:hypothetical protein
MNTTRIAPLLIAFATSLAVTGCGRADATNATAAGSGPVVSVRDSSAPPADPKAAGSVVGADMRNVYFHIDTGIILRIARLHGGLVPTRAGIPPRLDDASSFVLELDAAEIGIDTASLSALLNRHVFGYRGSPLKRLKMTVDGDQLVQTGVLHKAVDMPFRIRASVALTPDGMIRIHPTAVKVLGMNAEGVMKLFRLDLGKLITLEAGHGASIDKNDFILDPTAMLPPPAIKGRVTAIQITSFGMSQTFGPAGGAAANPLRRPTSTAPNYMYFHGATLGFGKLTMSGADLEIVDKDPSNPFDYSPARYLDHLVAGTEFTTPVGGLIVHMPDLQMLPPHVAPKPSARPR